MYIINPIDVDDDDDDHAGIFVKKEQASDDLIERFVFFFFKREREINNIFEGRRHVIGQSTGAHA
jgi:hypothetical protein